MSLNMHCLAMNRTWLELFTVYPHEQTHRTKTEICSAVVIFITILLLPLEYLQALRKVSRYNSICLECYQAPIPKTTVVWTPYKRYAVQDRSITDWYWLCLTHFQSTRHSITRHLKMSFLLLCREKGGWEAAASSLWLLFLIMIVFQIRPDSMILINKPRKVSLERRQYLSEPCMTFQQAKRSLPVTFLWL